MCPALLATLWASPPTAGEPARSTSSWSFQVRIGSAQVNLDFKVQEYISAKPRFTALLLDSFSSENIFILITPGNLKSILPTLYLRVGGAPKVHNNGGPTLQQKPNQTNTKVYFFLHLIGLFINTWGNYCANLNYIRALRSIQPILIVVPFPFTGNRI